MVHELVEIDEVRRMGLRITKDVIVRNMVRTTDAPLKAARVEFVHVLVPRHPRALTARENQAGAVWRGIPPPLLSAVARAA